MYFPRFSPALSFTSNTNALVNRAGRNPQPLIQPPNDHAGRDQLFLRPSVPITHSAPRFSGDSFVVRGTGFQVSFTESAHHGAPSTKVNISSDGYEKAYSLKVTAGQVSSELMRLAGDAEEEAAEQRSKIEHAQEKRRNLRGQANTVLADANWEDDRIASKNEALGKILKQIETDSEKEKLARRHGNYEYESGLRLSIRALDRRAGVLETEISELERAKAFRRRDIQDLREEAASLVAEVKSWDRKIAGYKVEEEKYTKKAELYRYHAQLVSRALAVKQAKERQREEDRMHEGLKKYVDAIEDKRSHHTRSKLWAESLPKDHRHFDPAV